MLRAFSFKLGAIAKRARAAVFSEARPLAGMASTRSGASGAWVGHRHGLFTVKGERHMGTNFMQHLLQHFFPHRTRPMAGTYSAFYSDCNRSAQPGAERGYDALLCCSKHGLPHPTCRLGAPPIFVLLLRNPYAWLSSMWLLPYTGCSVSVKQNFSAWLRRPFATYGMCRPERLRPTPVAVWNEVALSYQSLFRLAWQPAVLLRDDEMLHERALVSKLRTLARLSGDDAASRRGFALPSSLPAVRPKLKPWTPRDYKREAAKLRKRPWRRVYSADDLAWVNSQLSEEAVAGNQRVLSLN